MIITSNNKKDKNYKFSICTPCYNNSDSINAVFISFTNLEYQNFKNFELGIARSDKDLDCGTETKK